MVTAGTSSRWTAPVRSLLIGFGFFVLGSLSDSWLQRRAVSWSTAVMDDALLGIGASLLVFLYEQRQRRHIMAREQAEKAVKESEERFRLVANTAPVLIWMAGTDKRAMYFNQLWLDFTGRSEADLQASLAGVVHPDDYQRCSEIYSHAFDERQPFRKECRLRRHDGQYRWMLDIGVPRFHEDGSFAGYIGSSVDVTERKLAEEALFSVNRKLIEAQEQERTRVARELHDDINQRVGLLAVSLGALTQKSPAVATREIEEIRKELARLGSDIQALSHRLHSSKLDYLGLARAAASFCRELSEQQKVEIDFKAVDDFPKNIPQEVSLCLFRVLQEALQNAIKHSGSQHIEVSLSNSPDVVQLTVRDSGVGFDLEEAACNRGIGLTSMRERLRLVDGQLTIDSQRQLGTTIHARVPLNPGTNSAAA